ncbi:hypothetical protein [Lacimonas salitolerans]|uniref:PDZ domain-containing protein n=1 Tax=Lacimonas salitolerans TaxID=1323750 RepID=A0ABW4EAL5_9RHOB
MDTQASGAPNEDIKEAAEPGPVRLGKTSGKRVSRRYLLADNDIILAVNGTPWNRIGSVTEAIARVLDRGQRPVLLTVYRDQKLFSLFVDAPIDCQTEVVPAQEAQDLPSAGLERPVWEIRGMSNFAVFIDNLDNADIFEMRRSFLAMAFPPFWLVARRLWAVLVSMVCVVLTAFILNKVFGILVYLILCIYISRRQFQMFEFAMRSEGKQKRMVLAASAEAEAQKLAMAFHSALKFKFPFPETAQTDPEEVSVV